MTVAMLLMDAETIYNIANLFLAANSPSQVWHSVLMLGEPLSVILGSGTEWVALGGWGWSAGRMTHNTPARNGLRLPCTHTHTYHYSCTRLARTRIRLHAPSYALAERHLSLSLPSLSLSRALSLAVCVYVCVCVCVCVKRGLSLSFSRTRAPSLCTCAQSSACALGMHAIETTYLFGDHALKFVLVIQCAI